MQTITLKDYFFKLDEYKNNIDEEINETFDLEIQQFSYDSIKLIDARISDDSLFAKLEITNYNKTSKNYIIEVFKIKEQIHQVIYIKKALGIGIDIEKTQVSLNTIFTLINILEKYADYFNNPYSKKNILSLFKISRPNDEVLEKITLDVNKIPLFVSTINKTN